jgi:hypothetical protein
MLGENAARCYGLDIGELKPVADRIGPTEEDLRAPVDQLPAAGDKRMKSWGFRVGGPWH